MYLRCMIPLLIYYTKEYLTLRIYLIYGVYVIRGIHHIYDSLCYL